MQVLKLGALLLSAAFVFFESWTERHERVIDLEQLVRLRTNFGGNKRRYDTLDAPAQLDFVAGGGCRLRQRAQIVGRPP